MKPKACFFPLIALLMVLSTANAQQGNIVTMVTYKTEWPEGGRLAERDSLMGLWFENVVKKNVNIIHFQYFTHYYGKDSRDFVVLAEYKSLTDMAIADSMNTVLWRQYMPDAKKRAEFNQKLGRYFERGHSDEIYYILPKFTK